MRAALLCILFLISCSEPVDTDLVLDPTPVCDGIRQELEETTDAPFDRDGDGFFDAADPGCATAWQPDQLDCDDDDPLVNPAAFEFTCDGVDNDCRLATPDNRDVDGDGFGLCEDCDDGAPLVFPGNHEVCFDLVDNDCDGVSDNDCGEDYNGIWQLDLNPIDVVCQPIPFLPPFVDINLDQLNVVWRPPHLTISSVGANMPPAMNGTVNLDGSFEVEMTVGPLQPGICQERFYLAGTFTSDSTLEAVFSYEFEEGSPASCGGCNLAQSHHIAATKL